MVLPLSGSDGNQILLAISNPDFELTIKGPPCHKVVSNFHLHRDDKEQPIYANLTTSSVINKILVFDPFAKDKLVESNGGLVYPCFFEQTNYEIIIEKTNNSIQNITVDHQNKKIREAITPTGRQKQVFSGIINFGNEVGFSNFTILGDEQELFSFEIEVFPAKLDYRKDFQQLLREVNEEIYNLAFSFLMKTKFLAALHRDHKTEPSRAEFYYILTAIFERLQKALELIKKNPYHQIVSENRVVPPEKVKKTDAKTVRWIASKPHLLQKTKTGTGLNIPGSRNNYLPRRLIETKKVVTFDTFENRFLKWMLQRIKRLLKQFSDIYSTRKGMAVDEHVLKQIHHMIKYIDSYCLNSFLQEAGNLQRIDNYSLVIQQAPGYKDTYKYYLMLQKGLQIKSDLFNLSIKDLSVLYEYWCYLKITQLLREKYLLEQDNMVSIDRDGITVNLQKGRESEVVFFDPRNNERFSLLYNHLFTPLPTLPQKPDNILQLEKKGSDICYHYILDAKYRINIDEEYIRNYGQPGPPEDSINTMHRYRDAIISDNKKKEENNVGGYRKNIFGAVVLFPHNDESKFAGQKEDPPNRFYLSLDETGIGALPFLPGQTKIVEEFLDNLILESPQTAFERSVVQDGTEEFYEQDQKLSKILIGPLGRKEQLQACLDNSMYYTYLEQVKNYLGQLKFVALYQSKTKFKNESEQGIFYYGKIKDFLITKRSEIKEVPAEEGQGEKQAVKFIIDKWEQKEPPIAAIGYGPSRPLCTTWPLFKEAKYYPELHLKSEEIRLWRELKRIEDCKSISFPSTNIDEEDKLESIEFPGLLIRYYDVNNENEKSTKRVSNINNTEKERIFIIETKKESKTISSQQLKRNPGKTLREIIRLWKKDYQHIQTTCY